MCFEHVGRMLVDISESHFPIGILGMQYRRILMKKVVAVLASDKDVQKGQNTVWRGH